jgi:mannose-1-phosphate guanylyltransferase
VVEKATSIAMISYHGYWKDLGTWNTLIDEIKENFMGRVTVDEMVNSYVINELPIPVVVLGVKDLVIATSPDGILISDKSKCSYLKSYVENISERPMFGESLWGDYKVIDYLQYEDDIKSLTKHMSVKAGKSTSYQAHQVRDEAITIVSGAGMMVIDDVARAVKRGDVIYITKGQKHAIKANDNSDLHFIEVQIGNKLVENDFDGFLWEW